MPTSSSTSLLPRKWHWPDATLGVLAVMVVALMIVPLPTWLLDILLAGNLALSVTILLISIYITDALKIAVFPSVLLLTTLIRLALNVSSTRLILLQAEAGEVIAAFGQFVVRGNYLVGAVIFAILTVIQFVVIAKGSERVAEVGARFTLDAMPGKQMAIDADLRAHAIEETEAQSRRRLLARESQFHGAMDGAMKFVKGDTIAALVITVINIGAGLAVGVGQRGLDLGTAIKRYTLLTVGDGLVAQIPALLTATAAGILVTRVSSEGREASLGSDLFQQLGNQPKALFAGGGLALLLGLVPGLPFIPFMVIGVGLVVLSRSQSARLARLLGARPTHREGADGSDFSPAAGVLPWALVASSPLFERLQGRSGIGTDALWVRATRRARARVFDELGLTSGDGAIDRLEGVSPNQFEVLIRDVPAFSASVPTGLSSEELEEWCANTVRTTFTLHASDLLGLSEVQKLLARLDKASPGLVRQVTPKPVPLTTIWAVLQNLLAERVSIRDLTSILEALAKGARPDQTPRELTEIARASLRRALTYQHTLGTKVLNAYLLDPPLERVISESVTQSERGPVLALAPAACRDVTSALGNLLARHPSQAGLAPTILTTPTLRPLLRELLRVDHPEVAVLSFGEILDDVRIAPLGTVSLRDL